MGEKVRGRLIIIGGHEDKDGSCEILREVVRLAGGRDSKLVVLTTASEAGEETGATYRRLFLDLGASTVETLHLNTRDEANRPSLLDVLEKATGVYFTGGDQLRITSTLGGTLADRLLHKIYEAGVVIAGTSAGASAMSSTMIVDGAADDSPSRSAVAMAPGMGLLDEVVIDQHFAQRGRIGRLLSAVAQNPHILGVGIDEDTAVVVEPDATFSVIGSQTVTVVDGHELEHSTATESDRDQALAMFRVVLHVLAKGYRYDLTGRKPLHGWRIQDPASTEGDKANP
ncbi:MAG: cyanophycinase [Acidobacteriaceae bacterium]